MKKYVCLLAAVLVMATAAGAADFVFPNRLQHATVGEWVLLMDTAGPNMGERERFTVVEVKGEGDAKTIVIRREPVADDGSVGEGRDIEINLTRFADRMRELEDKSTGVSREKMVVGEREMTLWSMAWERENEDGQKHEYKVWVSEDLPVGGMFKTWSSDPEFSAAELIDCSN